MSSEAFYVPLERAEALALLRVSAFGRLATTSSALPVVVPVRIRASGMSMAVQSLVGPLASLREGSVIALEVGDLTERSDGDWTVMAQGTLDVKRNGEGDGAFLSDGWLALNVAFVTGWKRAVAEH